MLSQKELIFRIDEIPLFSYGILCAPVSTKMLNEGRNLTDQFRAVSQRPRLHVLLQARGMLSMKIGRN